MVVVFLFELIFLFLLSRVLTSQLSVLFYIITKSHKLSIWLMAVIFLPGTIIHEISHLIMAKLLFVYTGKIELMPHLTGESLKLGSVEVGKTDLLRNFLIGVAPFITGTSLVLTILYTSFKNNILGINILTIIILYFLFIISNTMYSSKKDMEGALEFFLFIIIPVLILYFLGVRIPGLNFSIFTNTVFENYLKQAGILLAIPLILDVIFILFAKIVMRR